MEKINKEVNFAFKCIEAYCKGYLESIEKYKNNDDKNTIVFIKGLLDHIKTMKKVEK